MAWKTQPEAKGGKEVFTRRSFCRDSRYIYFHLFGTLKRRSLSRTNTQTHVYAPYMSQSKLPKTSEGIIYSSPSISSFFSFPFSYDRRIEWDVKIFLPSLRWHDRNKYLVGDIRNILRITYAWQYTYAKISWSSPDEWDSRKSRRKLALIFRRFSGSFFLCAKAVYKFAHLYPSEFRRRFFSRLQRRRKQIEGDSRHSP